MQSLATFVILTFATLIMLLATTLPLSKKTHWIIRGLDFPRIQFAILTFILLIANTLLLDSNKVSSLALILISASCLIWQLSWILPYTLLYPKEVAQSTEHTSDKQLTIITANVLTPNRKSSALINLVTEHKPDILVTLESDTWWEEQLQVLEEAMPYTIKCPQDNLYGMHVYSRLALEDQEICFLIEANVPSIHATIKLKSGDKIRAHFLHPAPPSPTENTLSAKRDAELILIARSVAKTQLPVIVTGDLNDVAWSPTTRLFRKISGLLDPRIGRGVFNTFHADYALVRWPLDHLFHSQHFTLQSIKRLPSIGSDHFPLLTKLSFSHPNSQKKNSIPVVASDHDWAQEITEQQTATPQEVPQPSNQKT